MPSRLMTFLALMSAVVVGVMAGLIVAGTTTVGAANFSYDVPAIARVEVHEFDDVLARTVQLDGREGLSRVLLRPEAPR